MAAGGGGGGGGAAICVQLHAVAGLTPTHSAPFVRLVHEDVAARRRRCRGEQRAALVSVGLPENEARPILRRSHHGRGSEYAAFWPDDRDLQFTTAFLPFELKWMEVQVWNQFADVAVFLGATRISLLAVRRGDDSVVKDGRGEEANNRPPPLQVMWYPLDEGRDSALLGSALSKLSVQLSITVHREDTRAERIQRQIRERRRDKSKEHEEREGDIESAEAPVLVDPSFEFVEPSERIEWSSIVATSVHRIFLQGDIDELQLFYDDVLHGDLEQEMGDDDDIVVDEGHTKAFRLCQLSAQYLDHCVGLLDSRKDDYDGHRRSLHSTRRDRKRENRHLLDQKRRLEKESSDLEMLISTYEKLLQHHDNAAAHACSHKSSEPASPYVASSHDSGQYATSPGRSRGPTTDVVSKKPAFLMTWEDREYERKQQKELDKSRRIEDEKQRLQRLFQDRQHREKLELGLTSLTQRRRLRCARVIQIAARSFLKRRRASRSGRMEIAAKKIQKHARRLLCVKQWPKRRIQLRQLRECRLMQENDIESAEERRCEREAHQHLLRAREVAVFSDEDRSLGSPGGNNSVPALELVAMWKKLKRIFRLACRKGVEADAVFARLDSRGDGVVDRAEFRAGVRYFGVRIDRKMARAVVALVRVKCGESPTPIVLTSPQFARGFDLPEPNFKAPPDAQISADADPNEDTRRRGSSTVPQAVSTEISPYMVAGESEANIADRETSEVIEDVARAVAELRRRVLSAASDHLAARNKSMADYFAFREALAHVFEEFDADGNGELDLKELVECMAAIQFRVTPDNLAILRECFVADAASETVSISEFISFALAGMQPSSSSGAPAEEELGILGYRLRDAILGRIKLARKRTESIEDAVRLVFKEAYRSKFQLTCPRKDFARVLASLRLGFTPAQLSRLVLRLDQDGDNTISFNELLVWLRLRANDAPPSRDANKSQASSQPTNLDLAKIIRDGLREIAGVGHGSMARQQQLDHVHSLFRRVDLNESKKINASELETFLAGLELSELQAFAPYDEMEKLTDPPRLAAQAVKLIDLNGNGVVTLEEWSGFILDDDGATVAKGGVECSRSERYAAVEGIRRQMHDAFRDEAALLPWFRSIGGAIPVEKNGVAAKVRTREFKNAMRAKFVFIASRDLDEALLVLDADASGWITEKELVKWQFPTRDIEELTALIARVWGAERQTAKLKNLSRDTFVDTLYRRFDCDGNGLIARREVQQGFQGFRVVLNDQEAATLVDQFDTDGDGFWNKREFAACVGALVPPTSVSKETPDIDRETGYGDAYASDDDHDDAGYESGEFNEADENAGDDDVDDQYSLGDLSPLVTSAAQIDTDSMARVRHPQAAGVEYSEDFDEND